MKLVWSMVVAGMLSAGMAWGQEEEPVAPVEGGETPVVAEADEGGTPALPAASEEAVAWDADMLEEVARARSSKAEGDAWRKGLALASPVMDYAGLLEREDRLALIDRIRVLTATNGSQLVVATVASLRGDESKEFATKLFEQWGVGQKGQDNGVLLLVAVEERRVEIEVGTGMEGVLTDAKCGRILDRAVVPFLKKDQWKAGIFGGAEALLAVMSGEDFEEAVSRGGSVAGEIIKWTVLGMFIGVPIWAIASGRRKKGDGDDGGDDSAFSGGRRTGVRTGPTRSGGAGRRVGGFRGGGGRSGGGGAGRGF